MDMEKHMLICLCISMLMGREMKYIWIVFEILNQMIMLELS
jgi:hypothetical protein